MRDRRNQDSGTSKVTHIAIHLEPDIQQRIIRNYFSKFRIIAPHWDLIMSSSYEIPGNMRYQELMKLQSTS